MQLLTTTAAGAQQADRVITTLNNGWKDCDYSGSFGWQSSKDVYRSRKLFGRLPFAVQLAVLS
jgi:hypothetical protein